VRAVQTAELVVAGLHAAVAVEIVPALAPGESARSVLSAIETLSAESCVIVVGHEPGLSGLGALLVGQPDFAPLVKAEAARIVGGQLRWRFAWDADAPQVVAR
jgi:phosphohistidine phosphatase SixA